MMSKKIPNDFTPFINLYLESLSAIFTETLKTSTNKLIDEVNEFTDETDKVNKYLHGLGLEDVSAELKSFLNKIGSSTDDFNNLILIELAARWLRELMLKYPFSVDAVVQDLSSKLSSLAVISSDPEFVKKALDEIIMKPKAEGVDDLLNEIIQRKLEEDL